MSSDSVETFLASVPGTVRVHETTAGEFDGVLADVISEPAVGTPLPMEGITLDGTPVATDFSPDSIESATTGVTPARHGIANYGSITIPSDDAGTELVSLYADRHVAVLAASDVLPDMPTAYEELTEAVGTERGTAILATGPSATADMGTLVHGVHGPDEVDVILVEDR